MPQAVSKYEGHIENYDADMLVGWVWQPDMPAHSLVLVAIVDGKPRAAGLANLHRHDVAASGRGEGRCGFRLAMQLAPGETVTLVSADSGIILLPPFTRPDDTVSAAPAGTKAASDKGCIDAAPGSLIKGWCWDPHTPSRHLRLWMEVDGKTVLEGMADRERGDLIDAGIGRGDHAFELEIPYWMLDGQEREVHIFAETIGELFNSPIRFRGIIKGPAHLLEQLTAGLEKPLEGTALDCRELLRVYLSQAESLLPQSVALSRYADWHGAVMPRDIPGLAVPDILGAARQIDQDAALLMQTGTEPVIILLDAGARLHPGALARALELFRQQDADLLYGDADVPGPGGIVQPWFRPDWSYDLFLAQDYMRGLVLIRAGLFGGGELPRQVPEIRMVAVERARTSHILHVPEVLTRLEASSPHDAAWRETVARHLVRRGVRGALVEAIPGQVGLRHVTWPVPAERPLVSLIIPTRDRLDLLRPCIESILSRTSYRPFEIIIIDNQSREPETLAFLRMGQQQGWFRVMSYDAPFNYADMNNRAARIAQGSVLGFINNDVELITPRWLEEAVGLLSRAEVGAVGARLRFANGMIQHGGVIVGIGGGLAENAFQQYHVDDAGYFGRTRVTGNYSAVTAACLFCRKGDFTAIGGFDAANLPVAFNDVDLCLRWRAHGLLMVWTPAIELYHYESVSRGRDMAPERRARAMKEEDYMRNRWYRQTMADPYYSPNLNLDGRPFRGLAIPPRHQWGNALPAPTFPLWPQPATGKGQA